MDCCTQIWLGPLGWIPAHHGSPSEFILHAELNISLNNVTTLTIAPKEAANRCEHWWSWVLMIWEKTVQSLSSAWVILGEGREGRRGGGVSEGFITLSTGWTKAVQRHSSAQRYRFHLKVWWKAHEAIRSLFQLKPEQDRLNECEGMFRSGVQRLVACCMSPLLFTTHPHIFWGLVHTVNFTPAE